MLSVGVVSYLASALSFGALAIAVATRWKGRLGGAFLLMALVCNVAWSLIFAAGFGQSSLWTFAAADGVRGIVWLILLRQLIFGRDKRSAPRTMQFLFRATVVVAVLATLITQLFAYVGGDPRYALITLISSSFVIAVVLLVFVEQFYRNSAPDDRWEIKFFCFALGGMFVYDIYLFADGLLFLRLDADLWQARGAFNAIAAIIMAVSVRRAQESDDDTVVSRRMVFYTTGILGVGLYLLVMAAGGYAVRIMGGTWGSFAQILFLSGALFLLAAIMFSGQARARARVFLDKHFFAYRYDYRNEWLNLTHVLSNQDDGRPLEQRAIAAIAGPMDSPGGALWRRRDERFSLVETWNFPVETSPSEPADSDFCNFLRDREWIADLEEIRSSPEKYEALTLPDWLRQLEEAWLVVPLMESRQLIGFMVLARARAMRDLTWEDYDLLRTVGRQVAGHLALAESAQLLTETRQFQAYHQLTAFLMHDIKNLIAQQSLVVKNAARHKDNPEFVDDVIATVDNSVKRMQRLQEQLRQGTTESGARFARLGTVCRDVARQLSSRAPVPRADVQEDNLRVAADPEGLAMVVGHLVRNAQEATPADGSVTLVVRRDADHGIIEIRDTGSGMREDFIRDRLFKPFDTTKGVKGMGIGVYQAREFMRGVKGTLSVRSEVGKGSVFEMRMPLATTSQTMSTQAGAQIE